MTSCTAPVQSCTTGELMCPDAYLPDEPAGETWELLCTYCQAERERFQELVQDMRNEDG